MNWVTLLTKEKEYEVVKVGTSTHVIFTDGSAVRPGVQLRAGLFGAMWPIHVLVLCQLSFTASTALRGAPHPA
eukprot:6473684-Amphidinium_carterae.3